jgi:subtilisin family serine protease
VVARPH